AGAAANNDIEPGLDCRLQQHRHFGGKGLVVQQVFQLERISAEAAHAHRWSIERQGRDNGIDAGTIGQTSVHHRRCLVHATADLGNDAVDDLEQVLVVAKFDVGLFQLAAPLHENVVRPVDED